MERTDNDTYGITPIDRVMLKQTLAHVSAQLLASSVAVEDRGQRGAACFSLQTAWHRYAYE